jgi:hypothetical protein
MNAGSVKPNMARINKDGCPCIRYVFDIYGMRISGYPFINVHAPSSCAQSLCLAGFRV